MKLYLIYYNMPRSYYLNQFAGNAVYIPKSPIYKNDRVSGLYAMTTSKRTFEDFCAFREGAFKSGMLTFEKKHLDDPKEYKRLEETQNDYLLTYVPFGRTDGVCSDDEYFYTYEQLQDVYDNPEQHRNLVLVIHERKHVYENWPYTIFEDIAPLVDFTVFNDDIMDALDFLGYSFFFETVVVSKFDDVFSESRYDSSCNLYGYGLTPLGNNQILNIVDNVMVGFLYLYRDLIV